MKRIKKILHIDDEPFEVNGIKDELAQKGYDVTSFAWPEQAEDTQNEGAFTGLPKFSKFDLILLDVIMGPGDLGRRATNDGYTTGLIFYEKKIGSDFPELPVFLISALPEGPYKAKARDFAKENNLKYIQKSGDTVEVIIQGIQELETINGIGDEQET